MTVGGLEDLHGKPMETPSIPAGYVKSGALSGFPLFFFPVLKLDLKEALGLSTIIPILTNVAFNTKSQLTVNFHREKGLKRTRQEVGGNDQEDFIQKREMVFVHTRSTSQPSSPSITVTPYLNVRLKTSETISGFMSDFPKCRPHLQAAGGLGQEKPFGRCHCGKKKK